jgi:hypothetical protein
LRSSVEVYRRAQRILRGKSPALNGGQSVMHVKNFMADGKDLLKEPIHR